MPFRGLKTSTKFPLFPSHEGHKSAHERERANNLPLLRADTIRLLADFLIASANRIRKPADTIRKLTNRKRRIFSKNGRKNQKSSRKLPLFQDFARFFPSAKTKMPRKFWEEAKRRAFLKFSEKGFLSNCREVLGVLGQVGLVRELTKLLQTQEAAEHSPLWGRWRGLFS